MALYRTKPTAVEAVRWTGENWNEVTDTYVSLGGSVAHDPDSHSLLVATRDGRVRCAAGDWLLKAGDWFSACEHDEFTQTYEAVDVLEAV